MFLWIFGLPETCFGIALTWLSGKGRTLGTQMIHRELLAHLMQFYQGKDEEVTDGFSGNPSTCQKGCISKIYMSKFYVGGGDKNVVDDNTNQRGARIVFLIMNSIDILEELRMLMMIMTISDERFHEDVIGQ